ncbi:MAG TPA: hypothetical protein VGN83_02355 [Falsiroseomonas sp.]|nr:hypothetical protein [Falsiroseomonas sp.]
MSSSALITYKRGKTFVKNAYHMKGADKKPLYKDGKAVMQTAHGLVGELWIHGLMFETIERMDGYMHMEGGKSYRNSTLYWNAYYGSYVVNPWLGAQEKIKGNIMMHPASQASHLEGCVTVGFLNPNGVLEDSKYCLDVLWEQSGGRSGQKTGHVIVTVAVEGAMPGLSACRAWSYSG